jgi:hypothetical protein
VLSNFGRRLLNALSASGPAAFNHPICSDVQPV